VKASLQKNVGLRGADHLYHPHYIRRGPLRMIRNAGVTLCRTFDLGNFRSAKVEFSKEFYLKGGDPRRGPSRTGSENL